MHAMMSIEYQPFFIATCLLNFIFLPLSLSLSFLVYMLPDTEQREKKPTSIYIIFQQEVQEKSYHTCMSHRQREQREKNTQWNTCFRRMYWSLSNCIQGLTLARIILALLRRERARESEPKGQMFMASAYFPSLWIKSLTLSLFLFSLFSFSQLLGLTLSVFLAVYLSQSLALMTQWSVPMKEARTSEVGLIQCVIWVVI